MNNFQSITNRYLSYLQLFLEGEVILLDVRTHSECAGHSIKGAVNISSGEIDKYIDIIKKWDKPIFTFSKNGVRSAKVALILRRAGINAQDGGTLDHIEEALSFFKH